MAIPIRSRKVTHRDRRATTAATTPTPVLAVVEGRRRFAWFAVTLSVMIGGVMVGALTLHTRIAERQLQIDGLERAVRQAQTDFDVLRAEQEVAANRSGVIEVLRADRAELRSPTRLAERARALGMVPGAESSFLDVDPMLLAVVIATTGEIPVAEAIAAGANTRLEPLDQFRLVKSVSSEAP